MTTLFLPTMPPSMYMNLRKSESGRFGSFEASDGLKRTATFATWVTDYVTITPTGRDFVRLRESSAHAG